MIPEGVTPTIHLDSKTGQTWITREDDSSGQRRKGEEFYLSLEYGNTISMYAMDNFFFVRVEVESFEEAFRLANGALESLLMAVPVYLPAASRPFTPIIIDAFDSAGNGRVFNHWQKGEFFVFNTSKLAESFERAVRVASLVPSDPLLRNALIFLKFGDYLVDSLPPEFETAEILNLHPLQFLQYWKSVVVFAGDPSTEKDHQRRLSRFGFPPDYFLRRVQPLHSLRNKAGVAHVGRDIDLLPAHVEQARETAIEIVDRYVTFILSSVQSHTKPCKSSSVSSERT